MKHWETADQAIDRISPPLRHHNTTTLDNTHTHKHTRADWHTNNASDSSCHRSRLPKTWRLPTNVKDSTKEDNYPPTTQLVIILKLSSIAIIQTIRQAPRMLGLYEMTNITHCMALQLHNTPLHAGTLVWHAVTLSSIHSVGPHHVLIIILCYCKMNCVIRHQNC